MNRKFYGENSICCIEDIEKLEILFKKVGEAEKAVENLEKSFELR